MSARVASVAALLACATMLACGGEAGPKPAPLSIETLASKTFDSDLEFVRELDGTDSFDSHLVAYEVAGLQVHAMVAVPVTEPPPRGFPVVVANHGHHPDPPRYGITAEGIDARPGDYYRSVPELYASRGFLVVMPDYRGHNDSEGFEFTEGMLESRYYAEDVLALLAGLEDIEKADLDNVFMWGHSMGGEVTLRTLLATDRIRGASIWSTVGGDIWDQAYYYSRYTDVLADDSSDTPKPAIEKLRADIAALDGEFDWRGSEPLLHLDRLGTPLVMHHGTGDVSAPYKASERLAKELYVRGLPYRFFSYYVDDHYFAAAERKVAADRDAAFFRSLMVE
ncbi:MAG: alpha/beta fold hydrolase [Woeseiaceae bacterium]|nr:alpha/beta fold hydrolase [Woeseiaceae bacterium]